MEELLDLVCFIIYFGLAHRTAFAMVDRSMEFGMLPSSDKFTMTEQIRDLVALEEFQVADTPQM